MPVVLSVLLLMGELYVIRAWRLPAQGGFGYHAYPAFTFFSKG